MLLTAKKIETLTKRLNDITDELFVFEFSHEKENPNINGVLLPYEAVFITYIQDVECELVLSSVDDKIQICSGDYLNPLTEANLWKWICFELLNIS